MIIRPLPISRAGSEAIALIAFARRSSLRSSIAPSRISQISEIASRLAKDFAGRVCAGREAIAVAPRPRLGKPALAGQYYGCRAVFSGTSGRCSVCHALMPPLVLSPRIHFPEVVWPPKLRIRQRGSRRNACR